MDTVDNIIFGVVCTSIFIGLLYVLFDCVFLKYFPKDTLSENTITRDVSTTITSRIDNDKEFAESLLTEAISCFATKDVYTTKELLKKLIESKTGLDVLINRMNQPK